MKIFGRVQTGLLGVACVGSCAGFASLKGHSNAPRWITGSNHGISGKGSIVDV
jgi:hypothetical protein